MFSNLEQLHTNKKRKDVQKSDKKLMSKVVSRLFDNKFTLKISSNNIN